jgi:RimJ/RimL family protein N-acetyltransferase
MKRSLIFIPLLCAFNSALYASDNSPNTSTQQPTYRYDQEAWQRFKTAVFQNDKICLRMPQETDRERLIALCEGLDFPTKLAQFILNAPPKETIFARIITEKNKNEPFGFVGFGKVRNAMDRLEFFTTIAASAHYQTYITDIMALALSIGFDQLHIAKLQTASIDGDNIMSSIAKQLGFQEESRKEFPDGTATIYSLTRDRYDQLKTVSDE